MLIKAKERKTLVSAAEGVASREKWPVFPALSHHHRPSVATAYPPYRWAIYRDTSWESVCRDFYPAGVTTALRPTGCPSLRGGLCARGSRLPLSVGSVGYRPPGDRQILVRWWGIKKTKAGQEHREGDCVTSEVDAPRARHRVFSTLPPGSVRSRTVHASNLPKLLMIEAANRFDRLCTKGDGRGAICIGIGAPSDFHGNSMEIILQPPKKIHNRCMADRSISRALLRRLLRR